MPRYGCNQEPQCHVFFHKGLLQEFECRAIEAYLFGFPTRAVSDGQEPIEESVLQFHAQVTRLFSRESVLLDQLLHAGQQCWKQTDLLGMVSRLEYIAPVICRPQVAAPARYSTFDSFEVC